MLQKYKTLKGIFEAEIIEKKSRFIGTAVPVADESHAKEFIASCKSKYRDASHNTYAYQIGQANELQRISDDGEPSGTAGYPILDVLKNGEIKNACIVVTRYFGGVLLGTGGLARAYGKAARLAVKDNVAELILQREITADFDYGYLERINRISQQSGCLIQDTAYSDTVKITLLIADDCADAYVTALTELTNGRALIEYGGLVYG